MKLSSTDPGFIVSGLGHAALLVAMLFAFSDAKTFGDAQEWIPIQIATDQQVAEIMKGVKTEKEIRPQPTRVDKVADIAETHQGPPVADAKTDVPTPQPPPRPKDEPKKADVTPPLPPQRPAPAKPKPDDRLKLDEVAKIIDATKTDKPASKPRSGDETADPTPRLDAAEVSRLLSKDAPQQKASTGRELSRVASLGSPTASAAKMSPSLWGQLDGLLVGQYKKCWSYLGLNGSDQYFPEIQVEFTPDGALAARPVLRNPPNDPNMRSLADSALRAVQECNPLKIPPQYAPYYDEWKSRIVRFDPDEMAG